MGQAADLIESAVRKSRRVQREYGRIEGLRAGVERPAVRAASRLFRELCLRRCAFDQRFLAAGKQWPADRHHRPRPYTWNFRGTDARESEDQRERRCCLRHEYLVWIRSCPGRERSLSRRRTDATVAHAGRNDCTEIIELRGHESLGSTDSQALAHDPVRDQPVRQAEYSGPADAVQRAWQADERLFGQSTA